MGRFMATYEVRAFFDKNEAIVLVRATDSEAARANARPELIRRGVNPNDPLYTHVHQAERRTWEPDA